MTEELTFCDKYMSSSSTNFGEVFEMHCNNGLYLENIGYKNSNKLDRIHF